MALLYVPCHLISSSPWSLFIYSFLGECSQVCVLAWLLESTKGYSGSVHEASPTSENQGKKTLSTLAFSLCCVSRAPCLVWEQVYVFPSLPFAGYELVEAFLYCLSLLPFTFHTRFNPKVASGFPNPSLQCWTVSPYSSWITHPCFHISRAFCAFLVHMWSLKTVQALPLVFILIIWNISASGLSTGRGCPLPAEVAGSPGRSLVAVAGSRNKEPGKSTCEAILFVQTEASPFDRVLEKKKKTIYIYFFLTIVQSLFSVRSYRRL